MALIPGSGAGADQLTQYIERIERLEEEKRAMMADIRDVYADGTYEKLMKQYFDYDLSLPVGEK